jgi:hypothetical protein
MLRRREVRRKLRLLERIGNQDPNGVEVETR